MKALESEQADLWKEFQELKNKLASVQATADRALSKANIKK